MQQYYLLDPWSILEKGFNPRHHEISESVFSIGNGHMGQRANFEEQYSGDSLQGSYMAGVYYPDKTRVGWWKNGYPEYFAKVLNSTNWIAIDVVIDGQKLDLATCEVREFTRELSMKEGILRRSFIVVLDEDKQVRVESVRFVSIVTKEIGAIRYSVTPLNFDATITLTPALNGNVVNRDSNHGEQFWDPVHTNNAPDQTYVTMMTKKLDFYVCSAMQCDIFMDDNLQSIKPETTTFDDFVSKSFTIATQRNQTITLIKYVANVTSRDHAVAELSHIAVQHANQAQATGFPTLMQEQISAWATKWRESDIVIDGDIAAQQAIRFAIFQLNQTYTGGDERLNIGPKGFTGEKYGGSTYWDTEAYCLPFYLSTSNQKIARNLLMYRYHHLDKARDNARKLGFTKGALYPMVTMNGEECHNEWEITFEEIHRNGAIAYAIYNYVNYTGDTSYIGEYGLEVLAEISRFWAQRVTFSQAKQKYVMLGVTGPNEYENNVNNNWYTNRMATWTMEYTLQAMDQVQRENPARLTQIRTQLSLADEELDQWKEIVQNMYYPVDEARQIFLQQDGFLDKEIIPVTDLPQEDLPLNQHWSWDRILRSCYIKQADVLQGLFFLGDQYDLETKRHNFDFYEPITVHESSLSPCVHSILACELGYNETAYKMYLRTARLDLDNYNKDTEDGCHITSMAGTWMSVVYGFGGLRVRDGQLVLNPSVPKEWASLSFTVMYRGARLFVQMKGQGITVQNESDVTTWLKIKGQVCELQGFSTITLA